MSMFSLTFFLLFHWRLGSLAQRHTAFLMNHFRLILLVLVIEKVSRAQLLNSECPVDPAYAGCAEVSSRTWRCCWRWETGSCVFCTIFSLLQCKQPNLAPCRSPKTNVVMCNLSCVSWRQSIIAHVFSEHLGVSRTLWDTWTPRRIFQGDSDMVVTHTTIQGWLGWALDFIFSRWLRADAQSEE